MEIRSILYGQKKIINLLLLLLSLISSLGIVELGLRFVFKERLVVFNERDLFYRYDENLGWFPVAGSEGNFKGSRFVRVKHNSKGFRDSEYIIGDKPGIVFLGDSFVWGYDVEASERFTEKLQQRLSGWSIYNFGVSGYGTDQEYLLIKSRYDLYKPKIVFLVFSGNDEDDNSWNVRYSGYFKPYFIVSGGDLELKGVPVPLHSRNFFFISHRILSKSYFFRLIVITYFKFTDPLGVKVKNPTQTIISKINNFVRDKGAAFIIGFVDKQPTLEKFLERERIPYVDLSNPYRYPRHGSHWTPEGHTYISNKILEFLIKNKYLEKR